MTTDSHTLDRLQMHTGERAPDSYHKLCLLDVQRTASRLLPGSYSFEVCLAAVMVLLSGMHVCITPCLSASQASSLHLPVSSPVILPQAATRR